MPIDETGADGSLPDPQEQPTCDKKATIEDLCGFLRRDIDESIFMPNSCPPDQHSNMHANITLVFRHLEDARMRLGKVMQAYQGGVSILDK